MAVQSADVEKREPWRAACLGDVAQFLAMPNPLLTTPWEECVVPPRRDPGLERFVRREMGMPSPATPYLAACPWLVRAMVRLTYDHGLLAHVDSALADLIAMATHRRTGLARLVRRGVAERVERATTVPVILVPYDE